MISLCHKKKIILKSFINLESSKVVFVSNIWVVNLNSFKFIKKNCERKNKFLMKISFGMRYSAFLVTKKKSALLEYNRNGMERRIEKNGSRMK